MPASSWTAARGRAGRAWPAMLTSSPGLPPVPPHRPAIRLACAADWPPGPPPASAGQPLRWPAGHQYRHISHQPLAPTRFSNHYGLANGSMKVRPDRVPPGQRSPRRGHGSRSAWIVRYQDLHQAPEAGPTSPSSTTGTSAVSPRTRSSGCQVSAVVIRRPEHQRPLSEHRSAVLIKPAFPLVATSADVFDQVAEEGQQVRLDGETLYLADVPSRKAPGRPPTRSRRRGGSQGGLSGQDSAFVTATSSTSASAPELLVEGIQLRNDEARLSQGARRHRRPWLPLSRGPAGARSYIEEFKSFIIAVDEPRQRLHRGRLPAARDRRRYGLGLRRGA